MAIRKTNLAEASIQKIHLDEDTSTQDFNSISQEILQESKKEQRIKYFVLDFGDNNIEFKVLRPLTLLGTELKRQKKKLCILSEKKSILSMLNSEGLSDVIVPVANIDELSPAASAPSADSGKRMNLDVGFVNPFIEGVLHVLKVQCSLECKPGKPVLKSDFGSTLKADIAGVIGISNPKFMGSISICFPEKTFLHIISKMFGEQYTEITKDLEDGAGELLNMTFGFAKRVLNENGYAFEKALPTVVRGQNISVNHMSSQSSIVLPFKVEAFEFYMEIGTEKT